MTDTIPYFKAVITEKPRNFDLERALTEAFAGASWLVEIHNESPPTACYDDSVASTRVVLGEQLVVEESSGFPEIVIQRLELARGLHGSTLRRLQAGKWKRP